MLDNSTLLTKLESRLSRVDKRLMYERNKFRFMDTKRKRSFGKMFILSGINDYVDVKALDDKSIIEIGSTFVTIDCIDYQIAIILGALHSVMLKCSDKNYHDKLVSLGIAYYADNCKITYPQTLFLGAAISVKTLLSTSLDYSEYRLIGDRLFTENKKRKSEQYQQYLARKNGIIPQSK